MIDLTDEPPFVTAEDLADREFAGTFSEVDVAVACALVRGAVGWHIAPSVTVEVWLDTDGGSTALLPSLHVTDVHEVRDAAGQLLEGWEWSASGILRRAGGWPAGFRAVRAKVTHGLPRVPMDLMAVVADIAAKRQTVTAAAVGLKSKTVGEVTYNYLASSDVGGDDPVAGYHSVLWRYEL